MIKRLKNLGASAEQLLDVYIKQVRSLLEVAVPVWHSSLTLSDKLDIERVQKASLQIILGQEYISYNSACEDTNLLTLEARREKLCRKFANKSAKNLKHKQWFKTNTKVSRTRFKQPAFCPVVARTKRFQNSPISYLTDILNQAKSK